MFLSQEIPASAKRVSEPTKRKSAEVSPDDAADFPLLWGHLPKEDEEFPRADAGHPEDDDDDEEEEHFEPSVALEWV